MNDVTDFDVHFLEHYPHDAAGVLEGLDSAAVARVLTDASATLSPEALGALFAALAPAFAADCLAHMPQPTMAKLFDAFDDAAVTSLLRGFPDAARKMVLSGLPSARARVIDRRLRFAAGTVGAWMEGGIRTFGPATQVQTCIARLRKAPGDAPALIVLTESENRFAGAVTLARLISSDDKIRLRELVDPAIKPLPQNLPISDAVDNPSWRRHGVLPVVAANGEVVGDLSAERLAEAMSGAQALEAMRPPASILANLGQACLLSMQGFADLGTPSTGHSEDPSHV